VSSLEAENQDVLETLQALPEELNKVLDVASAKPEPSPGVLAELHDKLKSAEEKVVALESHATTWEEKAKSAEYKARSSEEKLVAKTKEFEATVQEKVRLFEEMLVAKDKELDAALKRNFLPKPNGRLGLIAGAILLVGGSLGGYAAGRHTANQKIGDLTNALSASRSELRLTQDKLASVQTDLAAVQNQLKEEVAKEAGIAETKGQQAAPSDQQIQQLRAQIRSRDNDIANLRSHATPTVPQAGVLIWSGTVARKTQIDITNGVANYGTVKGALPGRPCTLSTADPHVRLMTPPAAGNQWNRVSFEVLENGNFKVYLNWELAQ
jgi:chromosome segregation ATPase